MGYKSDIEIAQECQMLPITEIAAKAGIDDEYLEQYGAVFLMSDATVLPTVDEGYLGEKLSAMGVTGECSQIIYRQDELNAIFEEMGYQSNVNPVIEAVVSSEASYVQMAKEMLTGPAYKNNSYISSLHLQVVGWEDFVPLFHNCSQYPPKPP